MKKICSNCKYYLKGYCIALTTYTLSKSFCVTWKKISTTKIFYDKKRRQQIRKRSIKQEESAAKEINGQRQPMSGAGYHKGDVKTKLRLIELKFTDKNSYSLKKETLEKLFYEAVYEEKELPYLQIRLGNKDYCVILKNDLKDIIEQIKE